MIELHNLYEMVDVNASASIACAFRCRVASVRSFSIRRGSPYMGQHFRCRADTSGCVKPVKILIFLKNGKNSKNCRNGSGKPINFSRSWMTKWASPLDSSRKI